MLLEFYLSDRDAKFIVEFDDDEESLYIDIHYNDGSRENIYEIQIPFLETIKELFNNIQAWSIKSVKSYIDINVKTENEDGDYQSKKCLIQNKYNNIITFEIKDSDVPIFHIRLVNKYEMIEKEDVENSFYIFIP